MQPLSWNPTTQQLSIDLTGDGNDITFNFTSGTDLDIANNAGDTISLSIFKDGAWSWAMPVVNIDSYSGGVIGSNTNMNILVPENVNTNSSAIYNLEWTSATWQWLAAGNSPNTVGAPDYASENIITNTANEVSIDLDGDLVADISFTFSTPLTSVGIINFNTNSTWSNTPPAQYSSANILNTSNADAISIDLSGNGSADLTFTFLSTLTADGTISFDIDTYIPPFEYPNAVIDNTFSGPTGIYLDLDGDSTNDVNFAFPALTPITDNGTFQFDIDPRIPPAEYPTATISGDEDDVMIDINNDGKDDVTFSFENDLSTDIDAQDSSIVFDIEGSTAWTMVELNPNDYFEFNADFLGGENGSTEMNIEFNIGTMGAGTGQFFNDSISTTQYGRSSTIIMQSVDGYGSGDLQSVDMDYNGIIMGKYSNGYVLPFSQVALAYFSNNQEIEVVGENYYCETEQSGTAIINRPGIFDFGFITPTRLWLGFPE